MANTQKLDTHHKALTLNLDPSIFGSFAEIGAGQEVARWFLLVGGASGTVAKAISAYDKAVSDDLYGAGSRYVSKQRLQAMLDKEWAQLQIQLGKTRGPQTCFFSFADTVTASNYTGTNDANGWMGVRFQLQPGGPPHDLLLHINLRDPANALQQEAIGILGVNLIFAAFYQLQSKDSFLEGLAQDVVRDRIEVDFVEFRGPPSPAGTIKLSWRTWCRRVMRKLFGSRQKERPVPLPSFCTTDLSCSRRDTSATSMPLMRKFIAR